ncbi:ATP-binding protein [Chryseobacterium sp. WG23]|uniref:AlbA family DNA-binding domain-containing protein n=1 Tax=Chryseobacterium sp. WG23 TaxID=2926910 RepID=UPI00211F2877|nr:ATP-binding protein [Chryseobacterium sp. WG23]MCQ9634120.1 ATP-binding protein [Chryseobacterium sp. WG23]
MKSEIKDIVINKIENESEYSHLDFKKEQYPIEKQAPKKPEFLKDMIAFANVISPDDKYIIIGVEESNGMAADFSSIDKLNDQASYQQYINEYIEPEINFEYCELMLNEHKLAYFRLFQNDKFPYLFKKDLHINGFRFDTGSGFVRMGTSTRKLTRDDFEKMYASRHTKVKDRKNDLSFRVANSFFTEHDLRRTSYRHIRIDAINNSKKSLEFDVEIRILKSEEYDVVQTQDLARRIHEEKKVASRSNFMPNFLVDIAPPNILLNTYVEHSNNQKYHIFERTPERLDKVAVKVKQKSETKDIFNGQIAILFENPVEAQLQIIARSDDFLEGPLILDYNVPKVDTF